MSAHVLSAGNSCRPLQTMWPDRHPGGAEIMLLGPDLLTLAPIWAGGEKDGKKMGCVLWCLYCPIWKLADLFDFDWVGEYSI